MDWGHYVNAVRYVLQNPVRAGLVAKAEEYLWSSAAARCGLRDDLLISNHPLLAEIPNWADWLMLEDSQANDLIRRNTRTGCPIGSTEFVRAVELQTGRKLLSQKRDRPPHENPPISTIGQSATRSLFGDGDV
jgi:putative transposase